jgi:hypothetical protein
MQRHICNLMRMTWSQESGDRVLVAAGVPIKTAVAPQVLETVRSSSCSATYTRCYGLALTTALSTRVTPTSRRVPSVSQAYEGKFECEELQFGQRVSDKARWQSSDVCQYNALASFQIAALTQVPITLARHMAVQVEKQCAKFFTMHVDQDTIDQGFIIAAHSPALSKFKLLLFEQAPDGHQWELVRQVRAMLSCHVSIYAIICSVSIFG